jgi:hypothetical protein
VKKARKAGKIAVPEVRDAATGEQFFDAFLLRHRQAVSKEPGSEHTHSQRQRASNSRNFGRTKFNDAKSNAFISYFFL